MCPVSWSTGHGITFCKCTIYAKKSERASIQDCTIELLRKTSWKKKILRSQLRPSSTSGGLSAPNIKKSLISRPQPQFSLIQLHQRLGLQFSQGPRIISESAADQPKLAALANALKRIQPWSLLVPDPSSVFSSLKLGGFFTNAFSFSPAEPPRLESRACQACYDFPPQFALG